MTLAPLTDDVDVQRRTFGGLRRLRDALQEDGLWLPALSMGMSADYATAGEEGAAMSWFGTAPFRPRQPLAENRFTPRPSTSRRRRFAPPRAGPSPAAGG